MSGRQGGGAGGKRGGGVMIVRGEYEVGANTIYIYIHYTIGSFLYIFIVSSLAILLVYFSHTCVRIFTLRLFNRFFNATSVSFFPVRKNNVLYTQYKFHFL